MSMFPRVSWRVFWCRDDMVVYDCVKNYSEDMCLKQKSKITTIVKPYNNEYFCVVSRDKMT